MSGATDRGEDEQVPQFYGRLDEKFAEWETDVRLWQVELKLEDRDRLGPRLYRRGLHGQPKTIVKTKLGTQDVAQFHSGQHHSMATQTCQTHNAYAPYMSGIKCNAEITTTVHITTLHNTLQHVIP